MTPLADLWPYLVLILCGFLPNDLWRMLGVIVGHGVAENSELLIWVRAVAIALLAGVIAKIVVVPPSALATILLQSAWRRSVAALGLTSRRANRFSSVCSPARRCW